MHVVNYPKILDLTEEVRVNILVQSHSSHMASPYYTSWALLIIYNTDVACTSLGMPSDNKKEKTYLYLYCNKRNKKQIFFKLSVISYSVLSVGQ